jgi:hypothetical protein
MNNQQKRIVLNILKSELKEKQKALANQSGSGPAETPKPSDPIEPQKPEESKKKSKKQKKKNRRAHKAVAVDIKSNSSKL